MRLTKLKLAGFKSFVDPTHVALPGQLVGVVGPNGCGKSNIIDAVRWVLGESKASELRGESMQDVIFNGSSNRSPVARASVELIFDNALGRALGQWSQYAELSVKRILTRNGQSEYFINNLKVRRRDITDLFLGTGLGPRAYAIIGQGMISRIIEARPEDLRIFLEEAAGVSRYKERRKETQTRLEDTRENLLRIEDIRQELGSQIEKLQAQAEVARRYQHLNQELTRKQQLLWLLKRNEAASEAERLRLDIERATTSLEGQSASLRQVEAQLETAREQHFAAGDAVHQAQGAMFEVNADVARLEAEIRHRRESHQQANSRLLQLTEELEHWQEQSGKLAADRERWEELQLLAAERLAQAEARQEMQQDQLPDAEQAHHDASNRVNQARQALSQLEQRLHVEQTNSAHALRNLQAVTQRQQRLLAEQDALEVPDSLLLDMQQEQLDTLQETLAEAELQQRELEARLPQLEGRHKQLQQQLQQGHRQLASLEARQEALAQLQQQQAGGQALDDWLATHQLQHASQLWQAIQVDSGWELAVEALLRERLQALLLTETQHPAPESPAPARLTVVFAHDASTPTTGANGTASLQLPRLLTHITCQHSGATSALQHWLGQVFTANTLAEALALRTQLPEQGCIVTPEGHVITRNSLSYYAPGSDSGSGILERQRELQQLAGQIEDAQLTLMQDEEALGEIEATLDDTRQDLSQARQQVSELKQQVHTLQMQVQKLAQALEHAQTRQAQLARQLMELDAEQASENQRQQTANEAIEQLQDALFERHEAAAEARAELESTEQQLRLRREQQNLLNNEVREAQFAQRECESKLQGVFANLATAERQLARIAEDQAAYQAQLEAGPADSLELQLQQALTAKQEKEHALALCREALENAAQTLRQLETERGQIEQGLNPLRERINEIRLKAQAASLNAEQLSLQLTEAGADEIALQESLQAALAEVRPQVISSEITRLQKAIVELGAVNLAALEELETASQRKGFLDAQATDLTDAMQTLENAIRRIDRETRDLLKSTFDAVNEHFGRRFPELFGGGRAELVMTGEEILESGVQVIAQPPGKKNSTIHLLSGGEKALTAIALVFSFFQLNPAPFCLLDEVDAPLDDSNTERFCGMVKKMSGQTQFLFISHNKIAMEMAQQLVGVTMQESGVSRIVDVDIEAALRLSEAA
jgi:chromosome segregation protein